MRKTVPNPDYTKVPLIAGPLVRARVGGYVSAMTGKSLRVLALILGLALIGGSQPVTAQVRIETFERAELTIETVGGQRHRFEVELALSRAQHTQGLMYRRDLAADAGMLFLYERDGMHSMWMRNTLIPLDMLFITRDGRIVHIAQRTVPGSLDTISSAVPVKAVLEVNGGTAARLGLQPGDRVLFPGLDSGS